MRMERTLRSNSSGRGGGSAHGHKMRRRRLGGSLFLAVLMSETSARRGIAMNSSAGLPRPPTSSAVTPGLGAIGEAIREEPWRALLEPVEDHPIQEADVVWGELPQGLRGSLFRNGPTIRYEDTIQKHWFDGDGAIFKVVFDGRGKVFSQLRYVDTDARRSMLRGQGRKGPRRVWTNREGGALSNALRMPSNLANTSVLRTESALLALWEGGPPTAIDPITLETLPSSFNNFNGMHRGAFTAHPKRMPSGEILGYGFQPPQGVKVMRISPDGSQVLASHVQQLNDFTLSHDCGATDRHLILLGTDRMNISRSTLSAVLGLGTLGDAMETDPARESVARFYDRETMNPVAEIQMPFCSHYHIPNAWYDEETGATVILVLQHREGMRGEVDGFYRNMYSRRLRDSLGCELWRYEFDPAKGKFLSRRLAAPSESACGCELAIVDPRLLGKQTRYVYTTSLVNDAGILNAIQKVDLDDSQWTTAYFGSSSYAGEPCFVPKSPASAEDDGWLLTVVYNAETLKSEVHILDASTLDTLAIVALPYRVHYTFHGVWSETVDM